MKIKVDCLSPYLEGIKELQSQLSFSLGEGGYPIHFLSVEGDALTVKTTESAALVYYPKNHLFYLGFSLALQYAKTNKTIVVKRNISQLGTMQDCSDGVMSIEGIKTMIRQSALLGYTYLGLYLESTYRVEDEPYFGYRNASYSKEELKEIAAYGERFDVEIVPFIQTLGHMGQMLRWSRFGEFRDINDVMLADYEPTYALIRKMIRSIRSCFKTKRLSLGMDESYWMGSGRYHWFVNGSYPDQKAMFLRHLNRVSQIAIEEGFEDLEIWCDTLFEMEFQGYMFPPDSLYHPFSNEIKQQIPSHVTIRLWNYAVHEKEEFLRCYRMVEDLCPRVSFATIAHGYASFAPLNKIGVRSLPAIRDGMKTSGMQDLLITRWETITSPLLAIPTYFAYSNAAISYQGIDSSSRSPFLFGYSQEELLELDLPNEVSFETPTDPFEEVNPAYYLVFDDLFFGVMAPHTPETAGEFYRKAALRLNALAKKKGYLSPLFSWETALCRLLAKKTPLVHRLPQAYQEHDRLQLHQIADDISPLMEEWQSFYEAYRQHWLSYCKEDGFALFTARFAASFARLVEIRQAIWDYLDGKIPALPSLNEAHLPLYPGGERKITFYKDWVGIALGRKNRL